MDDVTRNFQVDNTEAEPGTVGARIQEFRLERGWSLSELARRVNSTPTQVRKLENGDLQVSLEWMRKFARAFETKMGALLPPEEMDIAASSEVSDLIAIFYDTPQTDRSLLLLAAREVVAAVRRLSASAGGPALGGDPELASAMSDVWQRWDDSQRRDALEILRAVGRFKPQ